MGLGTRTVIVCDPTIVAQRWAARGRCRLERA
jgi:hypothetical protein